MITPLAALEPYMAAEEASFNICMDSIISGFKSESKLVPVIGDVNEMCIRDSYNRDRES